VIATIVVALIAATPPTLAATLAFFAARGQDRVAVAERAATVAQSLHYLRSAVGRVEASVGRVEDGVGELRERVAHIEGVLTTRPASP
jgi:hypothetical protein